MTLPTTTPTAELEQGHGDPQLDREHSGEDDYGGEHRGELNWVIG
jgi:hypothetical protein